MNIIKKGFKREYIKPSIVMFAMSNEEYLLAASPNVRWKSHTNLTHPGKYFRPSKVKIMRPTSPK